MSQNAAPAQMSRGCCHDPIRSEGSLIPRIFDGGLSGGKQITARAKYTILRVIMP